MKHALGFLLFTALLATAPSVADEPGESGRLKGQQLDIVWDNHTLTGQVGGLSMKAAPLEKEFGMQLVHRAHGKDFSAVLKQTGKRIGGTVESLDRLSRSVRAAIEITAVDPAKGLIQGTLNGSPFNVVVSATSMDGHHFVAPRFDVQTKTKRYTFAMEGGKACMGCAVKISMVVLAMLGVTGVL